MNKIEELVYGLPENIQDKVLGVAHDSDDCCTVYCKSIDAIDDYIRQLQDALQKVVDDSECGLVPKSHLDNISKLL